MMNSSPALDSWTWFAAENRVWLMVIVTVIGLAAPFLGALRKDRVRPVPSVVLRSGATALGFAAALVTVCSLTHFTDVRWLTPAQQVTMHLDAPGGMFSFARPIVGAVNAAAGVPVEFRAIQASIHVAIVCGLIALGALLVAALTSGRARRAEIRQFVRNEIRKSAGSGKADVSV
jgi:hypothetical protein